MYLIFAKILRFPFQIQDVTATPHYPLPTAHSPTISLPINHVCLIIVGDRLYPINNSLLEINPPQSNRLPEVAALDRICFGGLWSVEGYRQELNNPNSDLLALSIAPDCQIIGISCAWSILDESHITLLGIHPQYRDQGLGQILLLQLLQKARKRGLKRATLEVRESNQIALYLYKKFGFQQTNGMCIRNYERQPGNVK